MKGSFKEKCEFPPSIEGTVWEENIKAFFISLSASSTNLSMPTFTQGWHIINTQECVFL